MKIPFSYILRNLWTRRLTTALTAGGMALVVFVFAAVLMLDAGLRKTLVATGSADNVILLRQGVQTEKSLCLTLLGGLLGIALSFPVIATFKSLIGTIFPVFRLSQETLWWQLGAVIFVGVLAAILPAIRSARIRIVDGLRHVA